MIGEKYFFEQPLNYDNIQKITIDEGDDYTTSF